MTPSTGWKPVTLATDTDPPQRVRCGGCRVQKDAVLMYSILHLPPGLQAVVWNELGCGTCAGEVDYICDSCRQLLWHRGAITMLEWQEHAGAPQQALDRIRARKDIPQPAP
jgi:hypothetical protein